MCARFTHHYWISGRLEENTQDFWQLPEEIIDSSQFRIIIQHGHGI